MESSIISLKERLEMPFIMYGHENHKIKIVDLNKASEDVLSKRLDKTSVVEIRPIRVDRFKETRVSISYTRDANTGIYYGIPIGLHMDGNVKWRKITLTDRNIFDLKNPEEVKMWFCARLSPYVKGSPFSGNGVDPIFEIYDPENEASKIINNASQMTKALNRAKTMKKTSTINFARYLGVVLPTEYSDKLVRAEIIKMATMNPFEFNRKFDDPNRKIAEVFYSGVAAGAIIKDLETGYNYKGVHLGLNELEVIKTLQKETMTLSSIISNIKEIDFDFGIDTGTEEEDQDEE